MDLSHFRDLIKERTGLSIQDSRTERLAEAIRSAVSTKGMKSPVEYYKLVAASETEFSSLVNRVTINETYFYREPQHFRLLVKRLFPELLRNKKLGAPVKILSAGCSTGEEPYSTIIALIEEFGPGVTGLVRMLGADIDSDALRRARRGTYSKLSFRSFDARLRDKYFQGEGKDIFRIGSLLQGAVDFQPLNLLKSPYPEAFQRLDVVFYRNVSIYFDAAIQRRIFANLAAILNEGGYIITSSTETVHHNVNILSLVELDGIFLYHKGSPTIRSAAFPHSTRRSSNEKESEARRQAAFEPFALGRQTESCFQRSPAELRTVSREAPRHPEERKALRPRPLESTSSGIPATSQGKPGPGLESGEGIAPQLFEPAGGKSAGDRYGEALNLARDKSYASAIEVIDGILETDPSHVQARTLKANILMNLGRNEDAEALCAAVAKDDPSCLEGYLLSGLVAGAKNEEETALKRFKEALYVRPSCWLAHFRIAEICYAREDSENARREYGVVVRLLEKEGLADTGLAIFSLAVPVEQIVELCKRKLLRLERSK